MNGQPLVLTAAAIALLFVAGSGSSGMTAGVPQAAGQGSPNAQLPLLARPEIPLVYHRDLVAEQQILLRQLKGLPPEVQHGLLGHLAAAGYPLPPEPDNLARIGQLLSRRQDLGVARVIQDNLKPMPIEHGSFVQAFPPSANPWALPFSVDEGSRVLRVAASVGRIESGETHVLQGTGFVVGDNVIATNCHVLRNIAQQGGAGWSLKSASIQIDFGDTKAHEPAKEYVIDQIAAYPQIAYLDVALLHVRSAADHALPPAVSVARSAIQQNWQENQLLISVIGYPNLANIVGDATTQDTFRRIRESGDGGVAKIVSPGAVIGLDSQGNIDFVDHVASTLEGESGSPVVDRATGNVIGIHYCCSEADVPQRLSALSCSSQRLSERNNNEAISTWTVVSNATLGALFARPAGSK